MKPTHIVLHQTADPSPEPQFAKVNSSHKARGFPKSSLGYFVGYGYFDGQDGTIKQARRDDEPGAHTVNCGCATDLSGYPAGTLNAHSIGICLAGLFKDVPLKDVRLDEPGFPTRRQIRSLALLVEDLQNRHGIPDQNILLHRETKATACPGVNLRELVFVERIEILKERLRLAQRAVESPAVSPTRKGVLSRFIDRVRKIVGGQ